MNLISKCLTIVFLFIAAIGISQKIDTVYSYSTIENESPYFFYPSRSLCLDINPDTDVIKTFTYIDSIKVKLGDNTVINKYHKKYYLKSYGKDSVLRVEGYFFDCYPSKNIIEYSLNGDTLTYGNYKVVKYKRPKRLLRTRKIGRKKVIGWKTHFYAFKDGEWITYDKERGKVNQTFYDIPNKKIKRIIYRTNLGKLKRIEVIEKIKRKDYILHEP